MAKEKDTVTQLTIGGTTAATTPEQDRIAKLEESLLLLQKQLAEAAAAHAVVPAGFKLVKDELPQDAKSLAEQAAIKAHLDKGIVGITQERADEKFPNGANKYLCFLDDKNGHPAVTIKADNPTDAGARYLAVCGINSAEKQVSVTAA